MVPVYLAAFDTPLESLINNIYNFIKGLFADGGPLDFLSNGIKFLAEIPNLFSDLPPAVIALLTFGVLGIVIGIILRIG